MHVPVPGEVPVLQETYQMSMVPTPWNLDPSRGISGLTLILKH